jgi:hypothetical protein
VTSDEALLNYATPRRELRTPRADWLAVFSFLWTFAVALPAAVWVTLGVERPGPLHLAALVVTPAVAVGCAHLAAERGAACDSGYRWTAFAVWTVPIATALTSAGLLFWIGHAPRAPM